MVSKKCLATACALAFSTAAFGTITADLVQNNTVPTHGADIDTFNRNVTHFTYDLVVTTTNAWTGSEVEVIVAAPCPDNGHIWHASNESNVEPMWNLSVPMLDATNPSHLVDTKMYDTFLAAPGNDFFVNPEPAMAPSGWIISTPCWIACVPRGFNALPLAWYLTGSPPVTDQVLARFTFVVPEGIPLTLEPAGDEWVFATIEGTNTEAGNPAGLPYAYTIYQIPEPGSFALLALGGLALLRRR